MDRHTWTEGYSLLEMCLVLAVVSLFSLLALPGHEFREADYHAFPYGYLLVQSQAIASGERKVYDDLIYDLPVCTFNGEGNVPMPKTLQLGERGRTIIIELGGGRLVFR